MQRPVYVAVRVTIGITVSVRTLSITENETASVQVEVIASGRLSVTAGATVSATVHRSG